MRKHLVELKLLNAFNYFGSKISLEMIADCAQFMRMGFEQAHLEGKEIILVDSWGEKHSWSKVSLVHEFEVLGQATKDVPLHWSREQRGVLLSFPKPKRHLRLIK